MARSTNRPALLPRTWGALATLTLLAVIIGCGGGGGGGNESGTGTTATTTTPPTTTTTPPTTTGAGTLPKNSIFYSRYLGTGELEYLYVSPTVGSTPVSYAVLPTNFQGLGLDPTTANRKLFGYQPDGESTFGIYANTSISATGATQIVAPTYSFVDQIAISTDGTKVYFVAAVGTGDPSLYRVAFTGGTPTVMDSAYSFSLSPDGTKIAYSKLLGTDTEIMVRNADGSGSATQLTNNTTDDQFPTWSWDGSKILFSNLPLTAPADLYSIKADGTSLTRLTNTSEDDESAGMFNEAGTSIAFVNFNADISKQGVYMQTLSSGTRTQLIEEAGIGSAIYWSSTGGRGIGEGVSLSRRRHR